MTIRVFTPETGFVQDLSLIHIFARMNERPRAGLAALKRAAGLEEKTLTAGHLGFQIGPRLNAGGRLGSARRGLELLLTSDPSRAETLAMELDAENSERRKVEMAILSEAEAMLEDFDFPGHRAIVLAREGWNTGVLGLAAARLVEEYHYPVILLCDEGGVLKGSCRSIPGVDIFLALTAEMCIRDSRSLDRLSVPVWPITLSGRLPIVALVGRYLAN